MVKRFGIKCYLRQGRWNTAGIRDPGLFRRESFHPLWFLAPL
jgi:hypothetical protein